MNCQIESTRAPRPIPHRVLETGHINDGVLSEDDGVVELLLSGDGLHTDAVVGLGHDQLGLGGAHLGGELGRHAWNGHGRLGRVGMGGEG